MLEIGYSLEFIKTTSDASSRTCTTTQQHYQMSLHLSQIEASAWSLAHEWAEFPQHFRKQSISNVGWHELNQRSISEAQHEPMCRFSSKPALWETHKGFIGS